MAALAQGMHTGFIAPLRTRAWVSLPVQHHFPQPRQVARPWIQYGGSATSSMRSSTT